MESEWLRDAIRLSLTASMSSLETDDEPIGRDPRLRKLAEGILYSRRFILTYHLVIIAAILFISASHWTRKTLRWKNRQSSRLQVLESEEVEHNGDAETIRPEFPAGMENDQDSPDVYSSKSSTINGTASPPWKGDENEETPLLLDRGLERKLTFRRSIYSNVKAFLMYQPRPIPIWNKVLPANGTSIFILAFMALNIFYMFFHINFNLFELFVVVDRFGLIFVANLPLLYLLATKNQPLKFITGRSYESLNIFHRRLGELLCLEAFLHAAGMICVWYTLLRPIGFGLVRFLLLKIILFGLGAFISYELLYFTSLGSFRQRWYELFLGLHVLLQVVALVFVYLHHSSSRPYVGISLAIFVVDRLVFRIWVKSTTTEAYTKILEDEDTVRLSSIIFRRPETRWPSFFEQSVTALWQPSDHVFLTVPSISRKHGLQAHPFTIASAAPGPEDEEARLDLLIRAKDGFSRDLLNAARLHKHLQIRLDGPYGSSHARDLLEDSDLALLIAGGSGIAVTWPLVQHLLKPSHFLDTETAPNTSLRKQKIILIWVIHESLHLSWLGREAFADAEYKGADIIVPRATEEIGRPDLNGMIDEIVSKYASEESKKTCIVASGPDSMGRVVRNTGARLVRQGKNIEVTIEKFGW